jgi:N-acetyl-anhydromuramyl-L-alanine amidase AmpD
MPRASLPALLGLVLFAGAGCGSESHDATASTAGPLTRAFAASARDVPRDLLVAIAHVEGGLTLPATRDVELANEVPAAGPLQLRHGKFDSLARAATLLGTSELALRQDADLALEGSARVLAELGARTGATAADLPSWKSAIEEMSGYADDTHRSEYAHRVFATLARGGTFTGRDGETITLAPRDIPLSLSLDLSTTLRLQSGMSEYGPAEWIPTSCAGKCTLGRSGVSVDRVVIHDTEGSWDASVATLQNDPGKSVQYIVGIDGRVGQFISEADTAWHAGNSFYNGHSVGIEHVGTAVTPYQEKLYAASALLVAHLTAKYSIPKDRSHIVGHEGVPNGNLIPASDPPCMLSPKACEASNDYGGASNHRDPGDWEWATYMARFGGTAKCDDVSALWSCNNDRNQAFRCAKGAVEVVACDAPGACEKKPLGQDDICHALAKPPSAGDAGVVAPVPSAPPPAGAPDASVDGAEPGEPGGCNAAPSRSTNASGELAFALGLGLFVAARRRSRFSSP